MADITSADFKQLITAITESNAEILAEQAKTTQKIEENTRESLRSSGDLAGFDRREEQKQRDEEAARAEEQAAAEAEAARIAAEKAERNGTFLGKITNFFSKPDAADEEDKDKAAAKDSKMLGYLKSTAGFLGGIAKGAAEKIKGGFKSISKFLFGAMLVGVLAFLNSPKFEEIKNTIIDVIVPALAFLYDEIIKPLALYIGGKLSDLFTDIKAYVDGEKGLGAVLTENIGIIAGIVTALAPGLVFGALKLAVTGLVKGAMLLAKGGIFAKIGVAFTALKTFFTATLLPAVTGFMVPLLPIIAIIAGIVLVLNSLKNAFDDFMFELEATGSIWEATKTGIVSVISNILGLPFDLLKDGVSWIIGKIGSVFGLESFTNASKSMDEFNFVDMFAEGLEWIGNWFSGMFDSMKQLAQKVLKKIPGGEWLSDKIFGTKKEQEDAKIAKEEEQKQFELNRKALKEKQKLEKEVEEAKKIEKLKVEQNAMQTKPVTAPALAPVGAYAAAASNIVNAPTSVVNANSSSNTTTSTPVRQPNMVIGMLAAST